LGDRLAKNSVAFGYEPGRICVTSKVSLPLRHALGNESNLYDGIEQFLALWPLFEPVAGRAKNATAFWGAIYRSVVGLLANFWVKEGDGPPALA
jgi:hypothetical protein